MRLLVIIINLLSFSCNSNHHTNDDLKLGNPVPASAKQIDKSVFTNMVLYKPNEFKQSRIINYNGLVYNVCLDASSNIIFIFTNDKNFLSCDGYRVGDAFSKLSKSTVIKKTFIPGYGVEVLLPSKWNATFLDPPTLQNGEASDISTIKSFYKRLQ